MNINKFKQGDIITRIERAKTHYSKDIGDGSYINDKLEFVGIEKSMIVLIFLDKLLENNIIKLDNTKAWQEGWDYYPQGLIDKAEARIKQLKNKDNKKLIVAWSGKCSLLRKILKLRK